MPIIFQRGFARLKIKPNKRRDEINYTRNDRCVGQCGIYLIDSVDARTNLCIVYLMRLLNHKSCNESPDAKTNQQVEDGRRVALVTAR